MGFTFKILLRGNDDKKHIACRIIINRKVKFYFLKLRAKKNDWSNLNSKLKSSDPESILKNLVIDCKSRAN